MRHQLVIVLTMVLVSGSCNSGFADDAPSESSESTELAPLYEHSRDSLIEAARAHLSSISREDQGYAVGVMPSLSRMFRDGGPSLCWAESIDISMARGELEHRELGLLGLAGPLKDVQVSVTEFTHESESATLQVTVGPVGFVRTPRRPKPNPQVDVGDVLLPPQTFDVRAEEMQAIYVLVESASDTTPGLYSGSISIQPAGENPTVFEVHVRVWDFVLPVQPPLHGWISTVTPDILLQHKLEPGWFDPPFDLSEPITQQQWQQLEQLVVQWFDQGHSFLMIRTPGAPLNGSAVGDGPMPEYTPEQIEAMTLYWRGMAEILGRLDLLDKAAIYVWCEPSYEESEQVAIVCDMVHRADARLRTCVAGWCYTRPLRDSGVLDIYCPINFSFRPGLDRSNQPYGSEAWWYVCWIPPAPAPNVMVDNPPLQQRIIGWQSWRFGVTGFVYWSAEVAMWQGTTHHQAPLTDCGEISNGGDGTLIYRVDGQFVPSLRLRHLGDGMEDLQYMRLLNDLLAQLDRQPGLDPTSQTYRQVRQAARKALGQVGAMVAPQMDEYPSARPLECYTSDPAKLISAREDLAQAILKIQTHCCPR